MNIIFVCPVFDRRKKATSKSEGSVEVRISQHRRSLYLPTGVRLLPKHWHKGQVVKRADAAELQQTIELAVKNVRRIINDLAERGLDNLDNVAATYRSGTKKCVTFLDFCRERMVVRCYGRSKDSRERYERCLRILATFGRFATFDDVTDANILDMDAHLSKTMKPYSKWQNYHRILKAFIHDAVDAGYMKRNPYKWLPIVKEKSYGGIGKYLTKEEFERLAAIDPGTDSLRRVRDLFVFQTYTCLSYVDMKAFDAGNIYDVCGEPVYTAHRGKTKQEFTFLILPKAMEILRKYDMKLPIITNVKYNQYLKVLAQMARIDKPLSSHWARHTGATLLLNEGLDMEVVSKVLGHSTTKITRQVYAKLLDDTIVKAMAGLK